MYVLFAGLLGLALYYIQFYFYKRKWFEGIKADAFFKVNEAIEGDTVQLTQIIENAKALPLHMVKMKLQLSRELLFSDADNSSVSDYFYRMDIYSIKGYEKVTRTIDFICKRRGYYDFHGIDLLSTDIFYTSEFIRAVKSESFLYVYPKPFRKELFELILNRINGEALCEHNVVEDPFNFRGIREYQQFDSIKKINWNASAKTEDLLVNMYDHTTKRTVRIFLNLDNATILKTDEISELCISMAASLAEEYCKNAIPVSLFVNSSDVLTDEPIEIFEGSNETHLRTINRALARIDLTKKAHPFGKAFGKLLNDENEDDNTFTIIVSGYMQDDFQNVLTEFARLGRDFIWLCPRYSDSRFEVSEELQDRFVDISAKEALYEVSLS